MRASTTTTSTSSSTRPTPATQAPTGNRPDRGRCGVCRRGGGRARVRRVHGRRRRRRRAAVRCRRHFGPRSPGRRRAAPETASPSRGDDLTTEARHDDHEPDDHSATTTSREPDEAPPFDRFVDDGPATPAGCADGNVISTALERALAGRTTRVTICGATGNGTHPGHRAGPCRRGPPAACACWPRTGGPPTPMCPTGHC